MKDGTKTQIIQTLTELVEVATIAIGRHLSKMIEDSMLKAQKIQKEKELENHDEGNSDKQCDSPEPDSDSGGDKGSCEDGTQNNCGE